MHRRAMLLTAASAALTGCAAPMSNETTPMPAPEPPPVMIPPAPGQAFDVSLYRAIAAPRGNQFVSPFSVSSALALLYPGARGQTASEIASVLAFDASPARESVNTRARADLLQAQRGGSEFTLANAAWVERTMQLHQDYARTISETLGATIEPVDFIRNQRAALNQINAWAARETRDRIREILSSQNPDRRLVLTNAVYFKGKWSDPFAANATRDGDFHAEGGATTRARLMRQVTHARYFDTPELQAAEFTYDEGAFALAVFLPRTSSSLTAFEQTLTGASLSAALQRLAEASTTRLDVTLPKVELNAEYQLRRDLMALGIHQAFTPAADLSGIAAAPLMVSDVIQKTFLAIDEDGTEAAAVTAVDVMTTAAPSRPPPPPIEFKCDRPFFIVLHHKPTRTRLFLGRIATTAT